jgi:hypothetical protein
MSDDLVTIQTYEFVQEAEAAKDLLEGRGFRAFLANADVVSMNWLLSNAIGYVQLQVPSADAQSALALLREEASIRGSPGSTADAQSGATACLACGALIPPAERECAECGWSYGVDPDRPANAEPGEVEEDDEDSARGAMDSLKAARRPVFLLLLSPVICGAVILAIVLLLWLAHLIMGW